LKNFNADVYINQTIKKSNYVSSEQRHEFNRRIQSLQLNGTKKKLRPKTTRDFVRRNLDI
jgi:hypothetical protein